MQWNVKDINVFSELSDSISKTVSMIGDIQAEADKAISAAESTCSDAISQVSSRQASLEVELEQLMAERAEAEDEEAAELDAQIAQVKQELASIKAALEKLKKIFESIGESRREYEASYLEDRDEYEENVSNICTLLAKMHESLEQGR